MSIFIDIMLILVEIFFILLFAIPGFAAATTKIGKTWQTVITTFILGPWIAKFTNNVILLKPITKGIHTALNTAVDKNPNGYTLRELFDNLPRGLQALLENNNLGVIQLEEKFGCEATEEIIDAIAVGVATPIASLAASCVSYIGCAIAVWLFFTWLKIKAEQRQFSFFLVMDHITGVIVGAAVGYCILLALSLGLHSLFQVVVAFDASSDILSIHEKSYIFKFVTEFNIGEAVKKLWQAVST